MNALDRILTEPWCIMATAVPSLLTWFDVVHGAIQAPHASAQHTFTAALQSAAAAGTKQEETRDWLADFIHQRQPLSVSADGIATVSVVGPLARGLTKIDKRLGASDYNDIIADLGSAAANPAVTGILLWIESPGGSVVGIPEARAAVLAAAQAKPLVAYTETCCASAAYAIACGADAIVASPSAVVGSVGTIATFADWSAFYERIGVKMSVLTAKESDLKSTWSPLAPMTEEQRMDAQRQMDSVNGDFLSWVKSRRPGAPDSALRGQWFSAFEAKPFHLVDQLGNRSDAIGALHALASVRS